MKKLVVVLNVIIALYFFALANLYFWGSFLGLLAGAFAKPELLKNPWTFFTNMLFAPFLIYGAIMFFRKTDKQYIYGLILLLIILIETQIYRFFFVTENRLEMTDLSNLAFFGIPFLIVYLTKYLNTKYVSGH
jgi:ACR3 family arsenite efflux pump ArsB